MLDLLPTHWFYVEVLLIAVSSALWATILLGWFFKRFYGVQGRPTAVVA